MESSRLAAIAGSGACLAVVLAVLVPYWLAPTTGVDVYYSVTPVGPVAIALVAVVALALFVGSLAGHVAPATAAGGTLVAGAAMVGLSVYWAGNVPPGVLGRLSRADVLGYHPEATVAVTVAALASAVWYAVAAYEETAGRRGGLLSGVP